MCGGGLVTAQTVSSDTHRQAGEGRLPASKIGIALDADVLGPNCNATGTVLFAP